MVQINVYKIILTLESKNKKNKKYTLKKLKNIYCRQTLSKWMEISHLSITSKEELIYIFKIGC